MFTTLREGSWSYHVMKWDDAFKLARTLARKHQTRYAVYGYWSHGRELMTWDGMTKLPTPAWRYAVCGAAQKNYLKP